MSRKTTKSDLSRADISLLINSEEAKNTQLYGNLYDILLQIKDLKAITLEELENCNLNYDGISALTYNKHTLMDNATKEWRATTDIIDNPKRTAICQLCNAPKLRYECHIRNIKNSTELLVGSECVNHFKIDGYLDQKKQLAQIHKGHKIVQRRNEFHSHFPDYENIISDAEEYFTTLPILLNYDLYIKLQDTIKRMQLISSKYVNEGKKPYNSELNSFELFQLSINQFTKLKLQSELFVTENKDSRLICKRREIDWLITHGKEKVLYQIARNYGKYSIDTLGHISSLDLIKEYMNVIIDKNKSILFKIEKIDDNGILFSFNKFGYQSPIIFIITLNKFMKSIGANCIIDNNYSYSGEDILKQAKINASKVTIETVINYIYDIVKKLNCAVLFDEEVNVLILYRKGDRSIRRFNPYKFLELYSQYILLSDDNIKKFLFLLVKGDDTIKWISPEVQEKQGVADKINGLYKNYRDKYELVERRYNGKQVEIITYNTLKNANNIIKINFDKPEYISFLRDNIKVGNNKLKLIDYAIRISDDSLYPFYCKNDIIFIQNIQNVKDTDIIFYVSEKGFNTEMIYTEKENENIFNYTNLKKKDVQAYGRIVYHLRHNKRS